MHDYQPRILRVILAQLNFMNAKIDMNQAETLTAIADVQSVLNKVAIESAGSVAKIAELEAALAAAVAAGQVVPQAIVDAVASLKTSVTAVDALVPDAPAVIPA